MGNVGSVTKAKTEYGKVSLELESSATKLRKAALLSLGPKGAPGEHQMSSVLDILSFPFQALLLVLDFLGFGGCFSLCGDARPSSTNQEHMQSQDKVCLMQMIKPSSSLR